MDYTKKFFIDLSTGEKYEMEILKHIPHIKCKKMLGNFKEYDLKIYHLDRRYNTYEIKADFMIHKTGNICIEYECNNKPSGISTSTARYWGIFETYEGGYKLYKIPRTIINKMIKEKKYKYKRVGGDNNLSKMYLFDKNLFKDYIIF